MAGGAEAVGAALDDFHFAVEALGNPEVIAVNLDRLGQCPRVVKLNEDAFLKVKDLEDGTKAVGLCNRGEAMTERHGELE